MATEFGHALRRWRDRVTPEAAGLPVGGHRRAVGLRREELAQLAGISVDYITRLEQGRATNPSEQVVEALGRALRLSVAVFDAAGTQLLANPMYIALMGEHHGSERNAVWRNFLGSGSRVRHTPEGLRALQTAQVADLRRRRTGIPPIRPFADWSRS